MKKPFQTYELTVTNQSGKKTTFNHVTSVETTIKDTFVHIKFANGVLVAINQNNIFSCLLTPEV